MTSIVQVKKKAQVTIPKEIREQLAISEGDVLEVRVENEAVVMRPRPSDKTALRPSPAGSLSKLSGAFSAGGDALKDSEAIHGD